MEDLIDQNVSDVSMLTDPGLLSAADVEMVSDTSGGVTPLRIGMKRKRETSTPGDTSASTEPETPDASSINLSKTSIDSKETDDSRGGE